MGEHHPSRETTMDRDQKVDTVLKLLGSLPSAAVAFSGGVDSSLLARLASAALGDRSLAITVDSIFVPRKEIARATALAEHIGIRHLLVPVAMFPETILANDKERCYHCKKLLFSNMLEVAGNEGMALLLDGSNMDDLGDYRPGMKALRELGVRSPLLECGLTKSEIRDISREWGLPSWDQPAMACLASRVVYGQTITSEILHRIEQAEELLADLGMEQVRVRCHDDLARIEVAAEERQKFFDITVLDRVNRGFRDLGFRYVSLDLEGYVTGKLNRK